MVILCTCVRGMITCSIINTEHYFLHSTKGIQPTSHQIGRAVITGGNGREEKDEEGGTEEVGHSSDEDIKSDKSGD